MSTSHVAVVVLGALLVLGACSGNLDGIRADGVGQHGDGGVSPQDDLSGWAPQVDLGAPLADTVVPNGDAFFANDPPPEYCGPEDGGVTPPLPGGTPECPDDKNREGCPCPKAGETAPCWPGLRVNRNKGICQDGVTTCQQAGELQLRWGACEGYVLPVPGATKGAESCGCFSAGEWALANLNVCFATNSSTGQIVAVSPYLDSSGTPQCPTIVGGQFDPKPGEPWSPNSLLVDCAGQFKLCYTVKAGDAANPAANDCVVAQACTEAWYGQKGVKQDFPPLPSWKSTDTACIQAFLDGGGYGEMSVVGKSVECETIDDQGQPLVFNRLPYCSLRCAQQPSLPECANCGHTGGGKF